MRADTVAGNINPFLGQQSRAQTTRSGRYKVLRPKGTMSGVRFWLVGQPPLPPRLTAGAETTVMVTTPLSCHHTTSFGRVPFCFWHPGIP